MNSMCLQWAELSQRKELSVLEKALAFALCRSPRFVWVLMGEVQQMIDKTKAERFEDLFVRTLESPLIEDPKALIPEPLRVSGLGLRVLGFRV